MNMNTNTDNGHQKDHMYAERGPNGHMVLKKNAIDVDFENAFRIKRKNTTTLIPTITGRLPYLFRKSVPSISKEYQREHLLVSLKK